jgi:hypothetical protein
MPTFKTNKTKRTGTIVQAKNNPNDYLFASVGKDKNGVSELHHLDGAKSKIIIDNQNILVYCTNGWTKLSVANVKEDETWSGWNNYFKKAKEFSNKIIGFNDKNEQFVTAFHEEDGNLILAYGNEIWSLDDEDLTMAVLQRNSPGTSRFDVSWAFHGENRVLTSVHNKSELESVLSYLGDVTDHVYDAGPDPYDWKRFLSVQKKDGGLENDWRGVFEPLTDEEEDGDDERDEDWKEAESEEEVSEEEDVEEFDCDESETDEDEETEYELTDASSVSSDDMEGAGGYASDSDGEFEPSLKRRRL